jgi:hypothetical protein
MLGETLLIDQDIVAQLYSKNLQRFVSRWSMKMTK